jgi:hypothetical protein
LADLKTEKINEGFPLTASEQAVIEKDLQIEKVRRNEEEKRIAEETKKNQENEERLAQLAISSKTPTRTIDIFNDVNLFNGKPRARGTILSDVNVDMVGSPFDRPLNLWFGNILSQQPYKATFTQTAMGWKAPCVFFWQGGPSIVFKDESE